MEEEKEVVEEKRKSNTLINILIWFIIILVSVIMYSKYIAPTMLCVKEYKIESSKIPESFNGVKIVYFADLLYKSTIGKEELSKIKEKINTLKPDILIFGGNLVSTELKSNDTNELTDFLKSINAKTNYAVLGDKDDYKIKEILANSNFKILENTKETVYNEDYTPIDIIGISSYNLNNYNLDNIETSSNYTIFLTHEADVIDTVLSKYNNIDLILSANTLGGLINIPYYGGLYKFKGSEKYYEEHILKNNTDIYISNGLGTRKEFFRLNNTPSITLFRLKSIH